MLPQLSTVQHPAPAEESQISQKLTIYVAPERDLNAPSLLNNYLKHLKRRSASSPAYAPVPPRRINDPAQRYDAAKFRARDDALAHRRERHSFPPSNFSIAGTRRNLHPALWTRACEAKSRAGGTPLQLRGSAHSSFHLHVSPRGLASHYRKHVVPVDFRRQGRRSHGRIHLFDFLSRMRHRIRRHPAHIFLGLEHPLHRSERSNLRRPRSLRCLFPLLSNSDSHPAIHYLVHLANSCNRVYRPLVSSPIHKRHRIIKRSPSCTPRWRCVVGACRRFLDGNAFGALNETNRSPHSVRLARRLADS